MRPVIRGACKYESLKDCSLDLNDIATINEALDVDDENRLRVAKAVQHGG